MIFLAVFTAAGRTYVVIKGVSERCVTPLPTLDTATVFPFVIAHVDVLRRGSKLHTASSTGGVENRR